MYAYSPNITEEITRSSELIVSVNEVGQWLNLSPSAIVANTDLIEGLIETATEVIEDYTWISLRLRTYIAYYSVNPYVFKDVLTGVARLTVERSPVLSINNITKIEYLAGDIWNDFDRGAKTIDGLYVRTTEKIEQRRWASIRFREPVEVQDRENAYKLRVTFQAGYDPAETDPVLLVPEKIKTAIKMIVAAYYTNRGDCAEMQCNLDGYPVPCAAKAMIDQVSIRHTTLGESYTPGGQHGGYF